jgi:hypothetical protein
VYALPKYVRISEEADVTNVVNFSLSPALCAEVKARSLVEDRPMSHIVTDALTVYLANKRRLELVKQSLDRKDTD